MHYQAHSANGRPIIDFAYVPSLSSSKKKKKEEKEPYLLREKEAAEIPGTFFSWYPSRKDTSEETSLLDRRFEFSVYVTLFSLSQPALIIVGRAYSRINLLDNFSWASQRV